SVMMIAISAGYIIGQIKKPSFWHVYSEMLYPVIFILSLSLLYYMEGKISMKTGLGFVSIPAVMAGFSLNSTVFNIYNKYDHDRRFNILNFSLFILPFPIILAASFLKFTSLIFFLLLYIMTILNLVIPGIFLFNLEFNR